jgi:hypothetical protein
MNAQDLRCWVRWLGAASMSDAAISFVLGVDVAIVKAELNRQRTKRRPPRALPRIRRGDDAGGSIRGLNARKLYRMRELGFSAARIADVLRCDVSLIRDFLRRITGVDGQVLAQPRTKKEQRKFDYRQKARARRAAELAARPRWPRFRYDEPPAAEPFDHQGAAELPAQICAAAPPPPLPIEPNRWHETVDPRTQFGERHGSHKLTWSAVEQCRRLHAEGVSFYRLGRQFGVHPNTVAAAVKGKTWAIPPSSNDPD